MKFFLLDGGGILIPGLGTMFLFMFTTILLEAFIMNLFKLNQLTKCFTDSLIVNIVSLLAGFMIEAITGLGKEKTDSTIGSVFIFFLVTVVVEGLLLMLLNSNLSRKKIWIATVVMNVASYLVLMLFTKGTFHIS